MTSSIDWEEIEEGGGNRDMRPPKHHRKRKVPDTTLQAAIDGNLKYTTLPLVESSEYECQTERHQGQGIPASVVFIVYEPDAEHVMRIHHVFPECGECNDLKMYGGT